MPTSLRKLRLSIEAACPVLARGPQYFFSLGRIANENKSELGRF